MDVKSELDLALIALKKTTSGYKQSGTSGVNWLESFKHFNNIYALLAKPDPIPVPSPVISYGVSAHTLKLGTGAASYIQKLATTGAKAIRDDVYPGTPSTSYDKLGNLCATNNLKLVLILWGGGTPPPASTFYTFAKDLVGFFKVNYPGTLMAIEPANEPNNNFLTDPATYVTYCNAVYGGIKDADSSVKLWAGATNGDATAWAKQVIQLGAEFDEWSCHNYPAFGFYPDAASMLKTDIVSAWSQVFWHRVAGINQTLEEGLTSVGYPGLIHSTEFGAPTIPPNGWATSPTGDAVQCCTEIEQANIWKLAYPLWRSKARAGWMFGYTGQDDNTNSTTSREPHFGWLRSNGDKKPIFDVVTSFKS